MSTQFILLWLEAPLQSWGADSKFGRRDTLKFPTKSGVLGILCCALGAGGEQKELLSSFSSLKQLVISYITKEREPLLYDFHMVGSGYDEKDSWESLLIPKTADGKKAVGGGTKMTYRYYLQDAKFAVIFEVPREKVPIVKEAFENPVWDIYLGRKNCVPTDFIFRGVFESEGKALEFLKTVVEEKKLKEDFRVLDGQHEGDVFVLNDVPLRFGEDKKYRERFVTLVKNDE